MGWGSGLNHRGEEVGYSVEDTCNEVGCDIPIDRGLAYCCGGLDGVQGEAGCGRYFCEAHLVFVEVPHVRAGDNQRCTGCANQALPSVDRAWELSEMAYPDGITVLGWADDSVLTPVSGDLTFTVSLDMGRQEDSVLIIAIRIPHPDEMAINEVIGAA